MQSTHGGGASGPVLAALITVCTGCGARSGLEVSRVVPARPCRVAGPTVLTSSVSDHVSHLVLDATHVYASSFGNGEVIKWRWWAVTWRGA
jgi:hypothetical protein